MMKNHAPKITIDQRPAQSVYLQAILLATISWLHFNHTHFRQAICFGLFFCDFFRGRMITSNADTKKLNLCAMYI